MASGITALQNRIDELEARNTETLQKSDEMVARYQERIDNQKAIIDRLQQAERNAQRETWMGRIIIAVLVTKLGGEVKLTPAELEEANPDSIQHIEGVDVHILRVAR